VKLAEVLHGAVWDKLSRACVHASSNSQHPSSIAACRKYTVEEFERFANAFARKQFGTTATMPPRMVEVRSTL
jgi:hypothetical protein